MSRHLWGSRRPPTALGSKRSPSCCGAGGRCGDGLDAPTRRAVDVITHDVIMKAIAELEADIARKEAELARYECGDDEREAAGLS